jgi:hypothetical protein
MCCVDDRTAVVFAADVAAREPQLREWLGHPGVTVSPPLKIEGHDNYSGAGGRLNRHQSSRSFRLGASTEVIAKGSLVHFFSRLGDPERLRGDSRRLPMESRTVAGDRDHPSW